MKGRLSIRSLRGLLFTAFGLLVASCATAQIRAVQRFNDQADLVQIACLDVNGDNVVDAGDADPASLPDITGDGIVDEHDTALVSAVHFALPNGKPQGCKSNGSGPLPDWQVSPAPALTCEGNDQGLLEMAIGGGAVDLATLDNAAGARWMVEEISGTIRFPTQIASVAPGLNGTSQPQPDAETWAYAFLSQRLQEQPCLRTVLLGHSHGGTLATAVAARLEEAGLAKQILLTALIDRVTFLYQGDTASIPQESPVFNVWLPAPGQQIAGAAIDQPNVENYDASGMTAPQRGERGGPLVTVNHTTIDNSEDVLKQVELRVVTELGRTS